VREKASKRKPEKENIGLEDFGAAEAFVGTTTHNVSHVLEKFFASLVEGIVKGTALTEHFCEREENGSGLVRSQLGYEVLQMTVTRLSVDQGKITRGKATDHSEHAIGFHDDFQFLPKFDRKDVTRRPSAGEAIVYYDVISCLVSVRTCRALDESSALLDPASRILQKYIARAKVRHPEES
jgi:hypothetical protein